MKQIAAQPADLPFRGSLFDQCALSAFVTDLNGDIVYTNDRFTKLTGFTREEALGKTPRILQSGSTPHSTYVELWSSLQNGQNWQGEIQNRKKDGSIFWCSCTISPIRDETGRVSHFFAVDEDITERKLREASLLRSIEQMTAFTAMASHDLRAPLGSITCALRLLKDDSTPGRDLILQEARDTVERTIRLIDDLMLCAGLSAGSLPQEPVDPADCLQQTMRNLEGRLGIVHGVIRWGALPMVRANKTLLVSLLQNLCENALKYNIRPPEIDIEGERMGPSCRFRVNDNGMGMTPEEVKLLFLPFQRLPRLREHCQGTGLGLYLCKKIVELHGGSIEVESQPEVGTTVSFTLPSA